MAEEEEVEVAAPAVEVEEEVAPWAAVGCGQLFGRAVRRASGHVVRPRQVRHFRPFAKLGRVRTRPASPARR